MVGYFGGQYHGDGSHAVDYAIWDSNATSKSSQPMNDGLPSPQCERFGGEGTGAHCGRGVDLFKGHEYSYHIELTVQNASGAGWSASIVDEYTGKETKIGGLFLHNNELTPHGSDVSGYGRLSTASHVSPSTAPVVTPVGGISFMEYYMYNDHAYDPEHKLLFYSSFGWIGPRFFPTSAALSTLDGNGAALRRSRGPTSREQGAVLPSRVMVDSEAHSVNNGCIPGYECGGARVFFSKGPEIATGKEIPALGHKTWIWNGTKASSMKTDDGAKHLMPNL